MCEVCAEHYFLLLKVASQQMVAFALCWSISFHSSFVSFITLRCVNLYRKLIGLIHIFPKISSKNERSIFLGIIYVNSVVWRNRGKSRRLFGIAPSFFTRHRCLMTVAWQNRAIVSRDAARAYESRYRCDSADVNDPLACFDAQELGRGWPKRAAIFTNRNDSSCLCPHLGSLVHEWLSTSWTPETVPSPRCCWKFTSLPAPSSLFLSSD